MPLNLNILGNCSRLGVVGASEKNSALAYLSKSVILGNTVFEYSYDLLMVWLKARMR